MARYIPQMTRHNFNAALEVEPRSRASDAAAPGNRALTGGQPEHVVVTHSLITTRRDNEATGRPSSAAPTSLGRSRLATLHGLPRTLVAETPEEAITEANREFEEAVGHSLELPIEVLIQQRDQALTYQVESSQALHKVSRALTTVREESARQCATLRRQLQLAWEELDRLRRAAAQDDGSAPSADATELRAALADAQREVEETRAEAARLQDERDEAIRETDDVRFELYSQVEAARDENIELQSQVDELQRLLDDTREEAATTMARLEAELEEARQQLQWQEVEMADLKARLTDKPETSAIPPDAARRGTVESPPNWRRPVNPRH